MMHSIRLPDGRMLSYAITGDPAGPPVFYFHGWPASRLEAALIEDLPVRLIAADRPGYAGSSRQPGRRLRDWAANVTTLADHLGVGRFHVVGVSGGAPYALVCAALLDRVAGVALISPLPPLARGLSPAAAALPDAALGQGLRRLRRLGEHPRIGRVVIAAARLGVRLGLFDPRRVLDTAAGPRDAACLTPALRDRLVGAWREGLRPGVAGAVSDARIYATPWGFEFAAVTAPVTIWHGTADLVVPVATLAAYAALTAARHLLQDEGHYSLALTRSADIVAALVGGTPAPSSAG